MTENVDYESVTKLQSPVKISTDTVSKLQGSIWQYIRLDKATTLASFVALIN